MDANHHHDDDDETIDFHRRETLPAPPEYPGDAVLASPKKDEPLP